MTAAPSPAVFLVRHCTTHRGRTPAQAVQICFKRPLPLAAHPSNAATVEPVPGPTGSMSREQ
eukprot:14593-Rhodomonas_salina.1